ncbi:MAG: hypothetical protein KF805_16135 [Phycisphaeraceae bacterium]|nr:hypothetical protein [Phycisphaeraceae bacterium]
MTFQVWLFWVAGVVLGGIATLIVAWAVFADRLTGDRGKRRCPRCWYDMPPANGRTCPECGHEARSESKLFRTRRRWGWAIVGLLTLACAFALNWYTAGRVLGWTRVMPLWMQVRLVPIIPEYDILSQNSWYNASALELDGGTAKRLQEIAIAEVQRNGSNPSAAKSVAQPAAYALNAIKSQITDRERVGKALLRAAIDNPGSMHHCAGKLAAELLGQESYFVETASMIERGVASGPRVAGQSIVPYLILGLTSPVSDQTAIAVADIAISEAQPGGTYSQLTTLIQENPTPFFRRLLERFRSGDKNRRGAVLWVLRANIRSSVASEPSYLEICREACAMLDDEDGAVREQGTLLIGYFFPDVIAPIFPEMGALLNANQEWTRRYVRTCLVNVKVNRPADEEALVAAVAETLRSGKDRGRALALEILILRKQSLRPGVDSTLLDAIERTDDAELADQLARQYCAIGATRSLFPATFGPQSNACWEQLEQRLLPMLDRGGAHTEVACRWIGRLPLPREAAFAKLQMVSSDASRAAPDRAAARDALLHIRDRSRPEVDVLEPLK